MSISNRLAIALIIVLVIIIVAATGHPWIATWLALSVVAWAFIYGASKASED